MVSDISGRITGLPSKDGISIFIHNSSANPIIINAPNPALDIYIYSLNGTRLLPNSIASATCGKLEYMLQVGASVDMSIKIWPLLWLNIRGTARVSYELEYIIMKQPALLKLEGEVELCLPSEEDMLDEIKRIRLARMRGESVNWAPIRVGPIDLNTYVYFAEIDD